MGLSVDDIRTYVKDDPQLNILLEGQPQSSDPLIQLAMRLAVGDFNDAHPVTAFTVDTFPNDTVLLYGTLFHLANAEAERQLRNNVTYSAQGLSANLDDKFGAYNQLAQFYKAMFETKLTDYKQFLNSEMAWGGEWSPYLIINQYNFRS